MSSISLNVNGRTHTVDVDPATPLLYVLSDDLALRGPKFGCGLGQCGACTVIIGGRAVRSCVTPVSSVGSAAITTLDGLGTPEKPHPIQQAFIDEQAAQCGFCLSGVILTAKAFLDQNPKASECRDPAGALRRAVPLLYAHADAARHQPLQVASACMTSRRDSSQSVGRADRLVHRLGRRFAPQARAARGSQRQLDSWIAIGADGIVTAYTGKCELGQGLHTAQMQLIAEELSVPMQRVRLVMCDTSVTPDQGTTSGSQSHPTNFNHANLALAAATAREALVAARVERGSASRRIS